MGKRGLWMVTNSWLSLAAAIHSNLTTSLYINTVLSVLLFYINSLDYFASVVNLTSFCIEVKYTYLRICHSSICIHLKVLSLYLCKIPPEPFHACKTEMFSLIEQLTFLPLPVIVNYIVNVLSVLMIFDYF